MPFSIRNSRAARLARDVSRRTGKEKAALARKLLRIARRCSRRPTLDRRSEDDILGYDERGVPRLWSSTLRR